MNKKSCFVTTVLALGPVCGRLAGYIERTVKMIDL
jgi:hypothetical protein